MSAKTPPPSPQDARQQRAPTAANAPTVAGELPDKLLAKLRIIVPGYKLLSQISSGGQAFVFKAIQEKTGKTVAIKILREGPLADETARERLKREVRVLGALNHPNIVSVFDSGQTPDGHEFLVMNYIAGRPLGDFLQELRAAKDAPPDPAMLLRLFMKICDAVSAAHLRGITHRDLSPSNIMIDERGEPHVLDFGLARTAFDRFITAKHVDISITGQFLGKLAYASPEQARGEPDKIDIRTDVYALGVMLYQMLTGGSYPYKVVGSIADVLNNIIHSKPMPPSELLNIAEASGAQKKRRLKQRHPPTVNPAIEAIVLKALEKDPANRYQSAGELGTDVGHYLAGKPISAKATDEVRAGLRFPPRLGRSAAVAGGVCMLLLLAILIRPMVSPASRAPVAPVDLLSTAHLPQDIRRGNWTRTPQGLESDSTPGATLNLNADLTGEFDVQVSFSRKEGDGVVALIFFYGGQRLLWYVSLGPDGGSGIAMAKDDRSGNKWLTGSPQLNLPPLAIARQSIAKLKVRKGLITGYLDDKLAVTWKRPASGSELPDWDIRADRLAIMSQSQTQFHSVQIAPASAEESVK